MLDKSGLAKSFWGEALAALVHVWIRCPTDAEHVDGATPYELWHGRKPDVSHLRVWGCTAYVHLQKDQCPALGSHMEKCVFIGCPDIRLQGLEVLQPPHKAHPHLRAS
ncbi:hypothetical protein PISMIDRAFT_117620 [Pisolithus microcarpus 441]|uniref:Copia protein n=1 Tax=Pisolithus microcarpus 441 TaxID=765257 RepID=A0A0C9YJW3_9AGAM|nr:copia protein [Pisolithus microcarpus]KIK14089.1 hypothetical protein PISMIDRAFT_117620 [Pisolithus microcarpus 441]